MEKEYLKKFLDFGAGNEELVAYDKFSVLVPEDERPCEQRGRPRLDEAAARGRVLLRLLHPAPDPFEQTPRRLGAAGRPGWGLCAARFRRGGRCHGDDRDDPRQAAAPGTP